MIGIGHRLDGGNEGVAESGIHKRRCLGGGRASDGALVIGAGNRALGGLESMSGFDPIKDVPNGRYLTGFFSNYPTQEDMSSIYTFVVEHGIEPIVARAFPFDQLPDAIAYQDAGGFQGKIVVTLGAELT